MQAARSATREPARRAHKALEPTWIDRKIMQAAPGRDL